MAPSGVRVARYIRPYVVIALNCLRKAGEGFYIKSFLRSEVSAMQELQFEEVENNHTVAGGAGSGHGL